MEANEDVHGGNTEAGDSNNPNMSNSGDKAANGGSMNPGGGPGGMKPGQNNHNDPMGASSTDANICRDYMRNVCTRGKKCKYNHPEKEESNAAATLLQDSIVFCHDFQNRNDCSRQRHCRFIHCRKEEEEEFKRSGFLPPHIRDQAITKGVAPDLPALYGARPICKDFLKGDCRRSRNCRFRHLSPRQYDMEMSNCYTEYDDGYGAYDGYEMPPMKRRRDDFPDVGGGHYGGAYGGDLPPRPLPRGGPPSHSLADMDMIQQENMLLKSRVEELKKQVSELTTTNNFLLEQNAQLRSSVKGPGSMGPMGGQSGPNPAVSMGHRGHGPPISMEMPMATTSISMAPQQMGSHPDSGRMVSYPGQL